MQKKIILCTLFICLFLSACGGGDDHDLQTDTTEVDALDEQTAEDVEADEFSDSEPAISPEPEEVDTESEEITTQEPEAAEASELEAVETKAPEVEEDSATEATKEKSEEDYIYYQLVESPEFLEWLEGEDVTYGMILGSTYLEESQWGVAGRAGGIRCFADTAINNDNGELYVLFDPTYIVYYCPDGTAYLRGQAFEGVEFAGEMLVDDFYEQHPIVYYGEEE